MDIIVTTPKGEMASAAREAEDCRRAGGGEYFRRFSQNRAPRIRPGDRVYYVEDSYVRGFALVTRTFESLYRGLDCDTTGRTWPPGFYVFMDATTWKWIRPIWMKGFRGFRYAAHPYQQDGINLIFNGALQWCRVEIVGGWLDPKPAAA